ICSSVNFDLFMVRSSHWAGLQYQMEELSGVRADQATVHADISRIVGELLEAKLIVQGTPNTTETRRS
ncbi:MAG: hypothetical protein HLUCCO06_08260, partial [Halomonas sp. HL-93]